MSVTSVERWREFCAIAYVNDGRDFHVVEVEERVVALCELHAAKVRAQAPASIAELRQSFQERRGMRSLLERRAPADRRAFPARPEGRRASAGRRASDRSE